LKNNLDILLENEDILAINKPAGLLSIPDRMQSEPSLKDILSNKYGAVYTVHRLDKGTSGVIVFARNEEAHKWLSRQFENRETRKYYIGLVQGTLPDRSGVIEEAITEHPVKKGMMMVAGKGKPSITEYEVLEEAGGYSLVQFKILTGRTHQIRVHMKFLGNPILCDELYGNGSPLFLSAIKKKNFKLSRSEEEERPILNRLALHAHTLLLEDTSGNEIKLEAPLPKDIRALMNQLRKWGSH
jgi:23S rRNA pseudouridine955/2504/2580 synthase/23S rRNA pseudouridine1911/1915/1917 synthase